MFEKFEKEIKEEDTGDVIKRKKHQCPHCKEILVDAYIEQNPFPEIPCPFCSSLIEVSSIVKVEIPSENERADKRCDASLEVTYPSFDKFITEYTINVSKGGMFVNTKKHHETGSNIDLFLHVPGLEESIKIIGEVTHTNFINVKDEDAGIGIKFIDIVEKSRLLLINFLKSQKNCG